MPNVNTMVFFAAGVAATVAAGAWLRAHPAGAQGVAKDLKRSDFAAGLGDAGAAARTSFGSYADAARSGLVDSAAAAESSAASATAAAKAAAKRAAAHS